jgi:hypothetical protein
VAAMVASRWQLRLPKVGVLEPLEPALLAFHGGLRTTSAGAGLLAAMTPASLRPCQIVSHIML